MTINKLNSFWLQIAKYSLIHEIRIVELIYQSIKFIQLFFYTTDIFNFYSFKKRLIHKYVLFMLKRATGK